MVNTSYICSSTFSLFLYLKYKKRLLSYIHHFKSDLIYNMDHMRISGTEPLSVILSQIKYLKKWKVIITWFAVNSQIYYIFFIQGYIFIDNIVWSIYVILCQNCRKCKLFGNEVYREMLYGTLYQIYVPSYLKKSKGLLCYIK